MVKEEVVADEASMSTQTATPDALGQKPITHLVHVTLIDLHSLLGHYTASEQEHHISTTMSEQKNVEESPTPDGCLEVAAFGQIKNGIPSTLLEAAPLLVSHLNHANWPELIEEALIEGLGTPETIRNLLARNIFDFSLRELLLLFAGFFRAVEKCGHGSRFIERAMVEDDRNY